MAVFKQIRRVFLSHSRNMLEHYINCNDCLLSQPLQCEHYSLEVDSGFGWAILRAKPT
jgi:hypothetical protein